MDADNRIIPLVDDDQGEGIKDFKENTDEIIEKAHNERMNHGMTWLQRSVEYGNGDDDDPTGMLYDITERLARLEATIKMIFDGHVLIDGRWRKVTP